MSDKENIKVVEREFEEMLETKGYKKLASWVLLVLFGGFLLWATFVPLDEGVPTMGTVVVDTKRKAVQHSVGGVIQEIYVREGDFVSKDQLLIKLGDAKAQSEVFIEEQNISSIKENINLQHTTLDKIDSLIKTREKQKQLIDEEYVGIKYLVAEGYAPKVNQLDLEKELNQLESSLKELFASEKQSMQTIDELNFRLDAAREKLRILQRALKKKEIRASVSGQVVGLIKQAKGSVIQPAEKIMDLVPEDELLVIEAEIMPNVIDRVEVNDIVDVRFTTFSLTPFLVVQGVISSISTDVLLKSGKGQPYYLARVKLTEEGNSLLGKRKMRPGMEVGVIVKTGSRTLLTYLLHPLTRRISFSLKEE